MNWRRTVPTGMRLSTLGLRFVLIFLLARYLPISDVGLYGLFTATVSYVLYPLGFDFYTYATRQIMRGDRARWRTFMLSQLTFAACTFAVLIPIMIGLFAAGLLPWTLLGWFFLLLPLEYLGVEIDRLLIAMSDQVSASVVLFVGGALNPLTAIPLLAAAERLRHLSTVLATWSVYDALAVLIGMAILLRHSRDSAHPRIDWLWIRRGVQTSLPFLLGTVCLRALFTFDRQVVKIFDNLDTLGAYTFYMSIGAGLTSVLYSGVQQFAYPRLIHSAHRGDMVGFRRHLRSLLLQSLGVIVLLSGLALAGEPILLRIVGGGLYRQYSWMLPVVFVVVGLYNLSMVAHFALYALDQDQTILKATVSALAAFVVVTAVLVHLSAVASVLAGVGAASAVLCIGKFLPYRQYQLKTAEPQRGHQDA